MPVIRIEPSSDKSSNLKRYPDSGNQYTKVNGSDFGNTSVYEDFFYETSQFVGEYFGVTLLSELPVGSNITQLKIFATISTANINQQQKMGFYIYGQTEVLTSAFSGSIGNLDINHTWTTNPNTGLAWTVDELTNINNYISINLKQSNPAANFNQCLRLYAEITYSAPSTFIPKIMIS